MYATILNNSSNSYGVELATVAGCNTTQACTFSYVMGYSPTAAPTLTGSQVPLSNGTTAYFTPPLCGGAGCSDSTLLFKIGSNVYGVGIKGGSVTQTIDLANSMAQF